MAGPIPLLNFNFGNPMESALNAALGTYQGVTAGQANKIQNELNQAKVPYAEQIAADEALMSSVQADYAKRNAETGYQKSLMDLQRAQAELKMYPQSQQALINYQKAQTGLANAEAGIKNFQLQNPGFMGGAESKNVAGMLAVLKQMERQGLIPSQQSQPSGQVMVETGVGPNAMPDGRSYSREDILGAQVAQPSNLAAPGMSFNNNAGINPANPYEGIQKAIFNNIERMGMQPWEIKGLEKSAEQQAVAGYKAMTDLNKQADAANMNMSALQKMNEAFLTVNPNETGWLMGHLPARSEEAQIIDQMSAQLLQQAQQSWTGSLSDTDISNIKKQFPTRATPEAFSMMSEYVMAANARVVEHQQFIENGLSQGIDINKLESAWQKYANENSVYDEIKRMHDLERKAAQ